MISAEKWKVIVVNISGKSWYIIHFRAAICVAGDAGGPRFASGSLTPHARQGRQRSPGWGYKAHRQVTSSPVSFWGPKRSTAGDTVKLGGCRLLGENDNDFYIFLIEI